MKVLITIFIFIILDASVKCDLTDCVEMCGGKLIYFKYFIPNIIYILIYNDAIR
jgi:hypothetical protein